jgi:putative DNA primase/helicase
MAILSANEAPESSDCTSGQERRKLTAVLDIRVPEYEGRDLIKEFTPFLPGLLKRVLEIPRERVTALIKHTEKNVPALAAKKWAQMIETNPIAAWVDECVIIDPNVKAYIGKVLVDPLDPRINQWSYPNFIRYQRESGHRNSMPVKRFSSNLRDLLRNQMKIAISEGRDRNGAYIQGIGLRSNHDPNGTRYPYPITGKGNGSVTDCDGLVTAESTGSVGCDGCDGFFEVQANTLNHSSPSPDETQNNVEEDSAKNPSHPSHSTPVSVPAVTNPSSNPSQPITPKYQPITNPLKRVPAVATDELEGWMEYHQCRTKKPYPNPNSDDIRSSQKRSLEIRYAFRVAKTKKDLSALLRENGGKFSKEEIVWVYNWLKHFFRSEFDYVKATSKIDQLDLDL